MKISGVITFVIMVAATLLASVAIVFHKGLVPGLDFGCGQYYYTDIPGWEKLFSMEGVRDGLPIWIYFVLFFLWGVLMYKAWAWIDSRSRGKDGPDERKGND